MLASSMQRATLPPKTSWRKVEAEELGGVGEGEVDTGETVREE